MVDGGSMLYFEQFSWSAINLLKRGYFHPGGIFGGRPGQYEVAPTMPRLPSYGVRVRL